MLEHKKIRSLDDYFVDLNGRQSREVYFYRINGYTEKNIMIRQEEREW